MAVDDSRPLSADKTSSNTTSANKTELLALIDQYDALSFSYARLGDRRANLVAQQVDLAVQMSLVSRSDPETHEFFMGLLERREEEDFRQNEVMEKFASERARRLRPSDCVRSRRP